MSEINKYWGIVPAAGVGKRMQADRPKQYLPLNNTTVIEQTLTRLLEVKSITAVVVAISKEDPYWPTLEASRNPRIYTAAGGKERADSVLSALNSIADKADDNDWVLVHDAARPCITQSDVEYLINELQDHPVGGILGLASHDTLKSVDNNLAISNTVDRSKIWRAFTPQMFRYAALKHALQEAADKGWVMTDDASAMELQGMQPKIIAGRADNLKITRPEDLALAQFYLEQQ
ncbi:MAG: 2-C-methyl-D-erythritol 4-phosphate cytidylyltransferase [Candidatus Methanofishera endochildressiae]|jgi:2-C-methyl-D-erythritol 4-phosphate cytidylyltransferase|uniref:2-C-methyl-D-erythritol 4-phosphate cytidylyltransferase n=1 Tax=Candidatus Methanofishera endochildressiae TaxID=2738884 RepID=A0A7Z0SDV0_9GAMM|nr:2-C-methyl-D-erythritol 4-phosphate cytidylyltransferase [Candidatus Methanofishera endochildressiae]SMG66075.1 2-C-methyl-D-erythritol 4-phosphate cytidylyltransferase [methanotrophic bacterial endosymbiont of Bathymodiolus sp.]